MRSPNLHVLHVITVIDRGGAENHLFDLVRHQRASGMAVSFTIPDQPMSRAVRN